MKTQTTFILMLALSSSITTSLISSSSSSHPSTSQYASLPKMNSEQLRELTRGFFTLLQLHASQVSSKKPMERVLMESSHHLFTEKIKNAVDGELVGLKGDIKHSKSLSGNVGEVLTSARGYFDKVKEAKKKLENPVSAVGDLVKDQVGNALGGLTSSLGFRALEEENKEEGNFFRKNISLLGYKRRTKKENCFIL